jgi:putative Mn2+ efflux pump MntP
MSKVFGVAVAVGLDVLAVSIGVGVTQLAFDARVRLGIAFAGSEIAMRHPSKAEFDATRGAGLLVTSLSISLDSLGVGIALPAAAIPLLPLLITVSISTTLFTFLGLAFGSHLGERYERRAERAAGTSLVLLAALFVTEWLV